MNEKQRQYRTSGISMFVIGAALLIMRIAAYGISLLIAKSSLAYWKQELILDLCFTLPVQVGVLFLATLLIYKIGLKKSVKEIFTLSGIMKKPEGKKVALSVLMGFFVYIGTLGVSAIWRSIIEIIGYNSTSSATVLPDKFNFGLLLLSLLLTAVLPALCEEFAVRGVFTKTLDGSFSDKSAIILGGLAFGLFHQYIEQFLYTMLFGMLITYIVLRTGCIWYGVIVHFINNGISAYLSYAMKYDFAVGGNFSDLIGKAASSNVGVILVYAVFALGATLSIMLAKTIAPKKKPAFDANGMRVLGKSVYKATKRDSVWFVGAIVLSALTTLFTFLFGFFA